MKRKEQYADEIIEMLERTKCGSWASNINLNTKDRVIEVCQNVVDSWSGRKFKDHCTTSPQTLEQTKWIPFTKRPMTDEEREYYREWSDIEDAMIFDCPLPEDGQEVLVSYNDCVYVDVFCKDDGCYFEGVDIDDVDAWMPLPQPYKEESEDAE